MAIERDEALQDADKRMKARLVKEQVKPRLENEYLCGYVCHTHVRSTWSLTSQRSVLQIARSAPKNRRFSFEEGLFERKSSSPFHAATRRKALA